MKIYEKSSRQLLHSKVWFNKSIESNPWVVYHATSSVNEDSIDIHGFIKSRSSLFGEAALVAVKFFLNTDWWDSCLDSGRSTLEGFSIDRSSPESGTPLYFALYPQSPYLYLLRDFCGGESAHALARAIPAILKFASDDHAISDHHNQLVEQALKKIRTGVPPIHRVFLCRKDWIRDQAEKLSRSLHLLSEIRAKHLHGVLYAVRLESDDVNPATYSGSDGLRIYKDIGPDRLVAKIRVSDPEELSVLSGMEIDSPPINFDTGERVSADENTSPLLNAIRDPCCDLPTAQDMKDELLDANSGEDITWDLILKYGNEYLRSWAKQQLQEPIEKRWRFLKAGQIGC